MLSAKLTWLWCFAIVTEKSLRQYICKTPPTSQVQGLWRTKRQTGCKSQRNRAPAAKHEDFSWVSKYSSSRKQKTREDRRWNGGFKGQRWSFADKSVSESKQRTQSRRKVNDQAANHQVTRRVWEEQKKAGLWGQQLSTIDDRKIPAASSYLHRQQEDPCGKGRRYKWCDVPSVVKTRAWISTSPVQDKV